ncbi:MAG: 3-deoxy-7-phosphoheptulonate synthase [Kiritimatiellia bacterium]|jgi:3-deoxy-7-phosphoheptulonate synthase|nr:3-deoxy-7-phosphoheptulonate synthase [Kiritimatiellia bacterium]
MSHPKLENVNIESVVLLATPREMKRAVPQTSASIATVTRGRETIERVLDDEDHRLLAIVGPCSIHHLETAETYARKLKQVSDEIADTICVVMRVYFEKPRSVLGWKGLINDPYMNDTFHIEEGIRMARHFLVRVAEIGLPAATEVLDTLMPQYIGDLISYSVIGARTAEAQTHREIASGMSTPVGFKNSTDGSLAGAINGIHAAMGYHHFLGVTEDGLPAVFSTTGNPYPHIVLRGGKRPNYDAASIAFCEAALRTARLPVQILVDCSHGNSEKQPERQGMVLRDLLTQIEQGNRSLRGFMLESQLEWGSQPMPKDPGQLKPGVSVTDACIDWETTEALLREAHDRYKVVIEERYTSYAGHARTPSPSR